MGHVRLGTLPRSRKWDDVVALLANGADVDDVAAASARAAESALAGASDDPVFQDAVWLLTNLPLAARAPGFVETLAELGVDAPDGPGLLELTAAIGDALDRRAGDTGGRTDLGEMAHAALLESLVAAIEPQIPSLFSPSPSDVRTALGRLSGGDRFADLARDFFTRVVQRSLDYFLSRELANHVGEGRRFASDAERRAFDEALAVHCRETSRIVKEYAGGWYGKTVWKEGRLTRREAERFARYGFKKLRDELGRRRVAA